MRGERETALGAAARAMLAAFEPLLARLAEAAPPLAPAGSTASGSAELEEEQEDGSETEAETEDEGAAMPAPLAAMLQVRVGGWALGQGHLGAYGCALPPPALPCTGRSPQCFTACLQPSIATRQSRWRAPPLDCAPRCFPSFPAFHPRHVGEAWAACLEQFHSTPPHHTHVLLPPLASLTAL